MPIAEAGGALMASMVGLACRGRTWEWEGLSIRPLPWLAGGLAASLAVVPLGAVWIGTSRIGHGYSPTAYVSAAMALVGISLLIGPSIAPALSWTVPLAVYLATVIVQVAWRPTSDLTTTSAPESVRPSGAVVWTAQRSSSRILSSISSRLSSILSTASCLARPYARKDALTARGFVSGSASGHVEARA